MSGHRESSHLAKFLGHTCPVRLVENPLDIQSFWMLTILGRHWPGPHPGASLAMGKNVSATPQGHPSKHQH